MLSGDVLANTLTRGGSPSTIVSVRAAVCVSWYVYVTVYVPLIDPNGMTALMFV